jgi:hypothetical protein
MPDAIQPPTETTAPRAHTPEVAAAASDGRLIQGVRRNLVLWSGGTTLVILLALAVALYAAVAGSLANAGIAQLDARMDQIRGERPDPQDVTRYGYIFGGGGSGTYALIVGPDGGLVTGPRGPRPPPGLPFDAGVASAASTGRDIQTTSLAGTPVRILTETVDVDQRTYSIQVVQDRTTERRTLETMLAVLIVGGAVVVLVAFGFGTIYLTVFTAWWGGQTPGKKLLGVRVLRLDGKPIGWWDAFERAGGYAAGFATGLLGFAQVFWDPNRQAIPDRVSSTVVVREGAPRAPGKWARAVDADPGRGVRYEFERREES